MGWPLHHADPLLVGRPALLFLVAYAFKAWGWQRLFRRSERPTAERARLRGRRRLRRRDRPARPRRRRGPHRRREALPGHEGGHRDARAQPARARDARQRGAHADGVGRRGGLEPLDDACRLRRRRRRRSRRSRGRRVPAPASRASRFVPRRRVGRWLAEHTHCTKEAWAAWLLISVSWTLRGVAVFLLLNALSMPGSYVLALAFLFASAASAALPIAPGGRGDAGGRGRRDPRARRRRHGGRGRVLGRRPGARHRDGRRGDAAHRRVAARAARPPHAPRAAAAA